MDTVVISGSAALEVEMNQWKDHWQNKGYLVTAWPLPIQKSCFARDYPRVHQEFYARLREAEIHFVANERRNGIQGYVGPGVFSEISFRVGLNLTGPQPARVLLLNEPDRQSNFYNDISLWLALGWINLYGRQ